MNLAGMKCIFINTLSPDHLFTHFAILLLCIAQPGTSMVLGKNFVKTVVDLSVNFLGPKRVKMVASKTVYTWSSVSDIQYL